MKKHAGWNGQIGEGKFALQFETNDRDLYKMVEKACQSAVDAADEENAFDEEIESSDPVWFEWEGVGED